MKKYLKIVVGCLLISIGLNIFIIPAKLVSSEIIGMASILSYNYGFGVAIVLLIINIWVLWLLFMIYGVNRLKKYLLPSILLPLFILATSYININIVNDIEELLVAIAGSFIMGYGYSLMYKEGYKTGAINILEDIYNDLAKDNTRLISRLFDLVLIVITLLLYGLECALYSSIVIVIIRYMTTKARIGISETKAFYIITKKEKEIKRYLMEELHQDLTEFEAVGGFTKRKNKVIMTVISTKDYFRVKEGINLIDPNAFISITDNYEVMNQNVKINKEIDN